MLVNDFNVVLILFSNSNKFTTGDCRPDLKRPAIVARVYQKTQATLAYSRASQSDLPTPAPGSLRISPRPQMEGGRSRVVGGKVFLGYRIGKPNQNTGELGPIQCQQSVEIFGNQ